MSLVCKAWSQWAQDDTVWRALYRHYAHNVWALEGDLLATMEEEDKKDKGAGVTVVMEGGGGGGGGPRRMSIRDKFKQKETSAEKKEEKKQRRIHRLTNLMQSTRLSKPKSFHEASREWHIKGGFRNDHEETIKDEEERMQLWRDIIVPVRSPRLPVTLGNVGEMVDIKKVWKAPHLKDLVRQGVPHAHRPAVWTNMIGSRDLMQHMPDVYPAALRSLFGHKPPQKFYRVPNFGGPNFDLLCGHGLSAEGVICAKRILCVLAMEFPEIQFCPTLPDLVLLFLRYLTEGEAYAAARVLTQRSLGLSKNSHTQYFATSFKGTLASCGVFDLLVKQHIPRLHALMKSHDFSIGILLYHKWFNRLFVDVLDRNHVLRIFDSYLLEGIKALFRVGLAILKYCEKDLLKTGTSQEFSSVLSSFNFFEFDESIFDAALAIPLRRDKLNSIWHQTFEKLGHIKEPFSAVYYRPKNLTTSEIITEDEFELMWGWLPPAHRIKDPTLVFTTSEHGRSLQYMMNKIGHYELLVFIILTPENRVFGFFSASPWHGQLYYKNHYFGEREGFIWTLRPAADTFHWSSSHSNDRMQYYGVEGISLGSGPPALVIHPDFTITSHACPTFQSPQLGLRANFDSVCVEVYTVQ